MSKSKMSRFIGLVGYRPVALTSIISCPYRAEYVVSCNVVLNFILRLPTFLRQVLFVDFISSLTRSALLDELNLPPCPPCPSSHPPWLSGSLQPQTETRPSCSESRWLAAASHLSRICTPSGPGDGQYCSRTRSPFSYYFTIFLLYILLTFVPDSRTNDEFCKSLFLHLTINMILIWMMIFCSDGLGTDLYITLHRKHGLLFSFHVCIWFDLQSRSGHYVLLILWSNCSSSYNPVLQCFI